MTTSEKRIKLLHNLLLKCTERSRKRQIRNPGFSSCQTRVSGLAKWPGFPGARACERSVSGAENGAERPENRVERSGAVSGHGRKTVERSGAERGAGGRGAGTERGAG